jgi:hypothetical protein
MAAMDALREAIERMDDVTLDRALEAAQRRNFDLAERLIAATAPRTERGRRRTEPDGEDGAPAVLALRAVPLGQGRAAPSLCQLDAASSHVPRDVGARGDSVSGPG